LALQSDHLRGLLSACHSGPPNGQKPRRQIRALGRLEALCPFRLLCDAKRSKYPLLALATKQDWPFPKHKSSLNLEGFARAKCSSRLCHRGLYRSRRTRSQQTLYPVRSLCCQGRLALRTAHMTWAVRGDIRHHRLVHPMPTSGTVVSIFAAET